MLDWLRVLISTFSSLVQFSQLEEQEFELSFTGVGYFFNPTFYIYKNKVRFITRTVIEGSRHLVSSCINIDEVTTQKAVLEMQDIKYLKIQADWPADPRYFMYNLKRYITFNSGHFERPNKIYIQEISDDCALVGKPIEVKFNRRREIEKNWSFFEEEGQLYTVYSIYPFKVLSVDVNFLESVAICFEHVSYTWDVGSYQKKYGELRGGCSPIKYGESYYFVVQSNLLILGKSIYTANLIQFDKSSFEPQRIGRKPIFLMTFRQIFMKPLRMLNKRVFTCIYPTGAQITDDNNLLISFGINDFRASIRRYKLESIFSLLTKNIRMLNK